MMASSSSLTFFFLLCSSFVFATSRVFDATNIVIHGSKDNVLVHDTEAEMLRVEPQNGKLCKLCEEFTSQAVNYLSHNKTQTGISDALHNACSQLHSLKHQCLLLVDHYTPLFFEEVVLIRPENFCKNVNMCGKKEGDICTTCHQVVSEVLTELRDPEKQLEIIEALLKTCKRIKQFDQQCKKLVFEFGPVILINAEKILESVDICSYVHACKPNNTFSRQTELTQLGRQNV